MGRTARKVKRANRKLETLTVENMTLYKADDTPVLLTDEDAHYRKAYRALMVAMDRMPPDGLYTYDGERMRWLKPLPLMRGA